ncbi:MAG: glycan-binding surface protein [Janthinobacterium lividum]
MSTFYQTLGRPLAYGLLLSTVALSACKKETEELCGGTPGISSVSGPTNRTAAVTSGSLADWVIIQGSNFCSVSSVAFNDVNADLKDAYITANEITLRVPRVVPKNVTNTITVTTPGGTAQTKYTVAVPTLSVTGMANEYAAAGQRGAVVGSNFDLYEVTPAKGKVLWNGTPLAITKTTADTVYFTVPANATPGATLKVVDGNAKETAVPGRYKDNRNIIFGYDTNGSVWGGTDFITTGPSPAPVNGPYVRINKSIGDWTWTEFTAHNNVALPSDIVSNLANYVLRFEVNTLKPFSSNAIRISIDGDVDAKNTYWWTPASPFNTRGQWRTMTVPLSTFIKDPAALNKPLHECHFVFIGPGVLDADISFDNFRVVPKN